MGRGSGGLAATTLRPATLADINRGAIRGWVAAATIVVAIFAGLAWPDVVASLIFVALAGALATVYVWIVVTLRDAEREEMEQKDSATGRPD